MPLAMILLFAAQPPHPTNPLNIVLGGAISVYQNTVSPLQGGVCNFSPSCSHFGKQAIEKYGLLWGTLMAADRLMRCNPWAPYYLGRFYRGVKNNRIYDPVDNNNIFYMIIINNDTAELD